MADPKPNVPTKDPAPAPAPQPMSLQDFAHVSSNNKLAPSRPGPEMTCDAQNTPMPVIDNDW